MKLRIVAAVMLLSLGMLLAGCFGIDQVVEEIIPNQAPIVIGIGFSQSPNGPEQHNMYEWDVYGVGYDPDGEIIEWRISISGVTYHVGHDGEVDRSEEIRYQFPQRGGYPISVTAIDDDGDSTTFTTDELWQITR